MTTIHIIRHGQSVSNLQGIFTGHLDLALTDLGQEQARITAQYIADHFQVDKVYSSDLRRAYDTGKAVARLFGLPVQTDHRLREIYAGIWEGKTFNELTDIYPSYTVFRTDIGACITDGGETVAQLSERVLEAFRCIGEENEGKTVVVATHATPIRALQCYCEGKTLAEMKDVPWVTNASVTTVVYENGVFRLVEVCHDAHLGSIVSRFPSNV